MAEPWDWLGGVITVEAISSIIQVKYETIYNRQQQYFGPGLVIILIKFCPKVLLHEIILITYK